MSIEYLLEKYLEKKGIDSEKIGEKFDLIVNRIEDEIDNYVSDIFDNIAKEWVWSEIEQELEEHPEWKLEEGKSK